MYFLPPLEDGLKRTNEQAAMPSLLSKIILVKVDYGIAC